MKALRTPLITAGLLVGLAASALAQMGMEGPSGHAGQGPHMEKMREHLREHRGQHHLKQLAQLKTQLQLQPAQEAAWTSFTQAMQPPATPPARPDRSALEKLRTPERIDQMEALHAQRQAEMKQRGEAAKAFYAQLSPEQQKTFDARSGIYLARDWQEVEIGRAHV